ncbi:MAG: DNA polymerase III subunit alpha [Odoribacteraceae bacterium]|jgi:DNA polymerase-3 subunit alpha|nr:DNA polymerase III subunit alpha [Odoribacteraceae bacterium]
MSSFVHFHVHSQYSILDGAASIPGLVGKAARDNMPAIALTDHGNMFGIKLFHAECLKAGVKPVLGVEAYVARVSRHNKESEINRSGEHLVLLAKNRQGYKNLMQLCSIAYTEGFYYRPRVDKSLLERYREGLIASSACLAGEICQKIMSGDLEGAEETARWYRGIFGEDYYLEVMRHPSGNPEMDRDVYLRQQACIPAILDIGARLGIKVIATNDVHFLNEEDAEAHDVLICLNTRKDLDDPNRMRYTRQEWFKTGDEMAALFADMPEALANTLEVADKVEQYELNSPAIMPVFPIPESFGREEERLAGVSEEALIEEFGGKKRYEELGGRDKVARMKFEADYLAHLTWLGVEKRWKGAVTDELRERVEMELTTIKTMGFSGYFLIVQDFIRAAREMGVIVGPGRGSAAGSVVAYCLEITNINPIEYGLLFERFLNAERVSMPDIDIDFDDDGRQQVLEWVANKYGHDKVAHIVTFGSMAAKSAIKDVARVLRLDLSESNRLSKMVPDGPKVTLKGAYNQNSDLLKEKSSPNPLVTKTLALAEALDGTVRQPGQHACGIIIGRDPLVEHIPVMPSKDDSLLTTQYDGHFVESIGLLKMDFLGLRTLTIIKICIENIRKSKGLRVNIDDIPMDDPKTFDLFSRGETTGVFQFESSGMKKHLKALQPDNIEFLLAMNGLYRPGPMVHIDTFIERRHGRKPVLYDHPIMEPYLKSTYGITIYQEQVMLLSRALAGFSRGESDILRNAMGKKKEKEMAKMSDKFRAGCLANPEFMAGCEATGQQAEALIDKIWDDWKAFASYAFNKAHAVCYAYIAYQTAYLKANYPAEFMAANLSCNLSQIAQVSKFMDECRRMGLRVLPPDVNESDNDFTVTPRGDIRFGLAAIKGVGEGAVEKIREARGEPFKNVYDFFERIDYRAINQKALESIIAAGGLESFGIHRACYFHPVRENIPWLEQLVNYGKKKQQDKEQAAASLFGEMTEYEIPLPAVPVCEPWMNIMQANKEKELIGIYLTNHPLDTYRMEMELLCTDLKTFNEQFPNLVGKSITVAGIVIAKKEGKTRKGLDFGILTIEDFTDSREIALFGEDYIHFRNYFIIDTPVYVRGNVQERKGKDGELKLEFKAREIKLVSELKRLLHSLTIEIDIHELNTEKIEELMEFVKDSGTIPVHVKLYDRDGHHVKLFSPTRRLECTRELHEYFEQISAMKLKIE